MSDSEFLTRLTEDVAYIQKLGDYPKTDNGLTSDALKAWFDKAPEAIKAFLNESLILEIEEKFGSLDAWIEDATKKIDKFVVGSGFMDVAGFNAMEADLNINGHRVVGVSEPEENKDAANKEYVDGKHFTDVSTLTVSGWSGESPPYSQAVSIPRILESDMPHIGPMYSADSETALAEKEAWLLVGSGVAADGIVTFHCFEEKPEVDITIQLEVNR